jgi:Leucine-rich repeat (LRR) protein
MIILKVVLRDMNIEYFDDNKDDRLKIEDLVNIEAILASHNIIRDLYGIVQLTSLKELNLSYNNISDIR